MSMQPEQALFLRDNAIRSLKSEQPVTQRVIEAIPLDKGHHHAGVARATAMLGKHLAAVRARAGACRRWQAP